MEAKGLNKGWPKGWTGPSRPDGLMKSACARYLEHKKWVVGLDTGKELWENPMRVPVPVTDLLA